MSQIAKLFKNGRSQAVRLPASFRFEAHEVFIRRDPKTGDVILSRRPDSWQGFFAALDEAAVPDDLLGTAERKTEAPERDPLEGWSE